MKIQIYSDLHIEFAWFDLPRTDADLIILAGDTGVGKRGIEWAKLIEASVPILYIHGNHEYYREAWPKLIETNRALCEGTNIHFLENDELIFGDVRILTQLAAFSTKTYKKQPKTRYFHSETV